MLDQEKKNKLLRSPKKVRTLGAEEEQSTNLVTLEEKGICDFGNDWILSRLQQHVTTTVSSHCGQVVYVSSSFILFTSVCLVVTSSMRFEDVAADVSPAVEST
jgi:hypothetical protein